jgi:multidrug transporter EmrE-like cation transporter
MEFLFLALLASLVSSGGGILLKRGLSDINGGMKISVSGLMAVFTQPFILSGLFVYFLGAIVWMKVLSKYPLSTAYPVLVGISFCIITFVSIFALKESVNLFKLLGIVGILAGIILIVRNT